MRTVLVLSVICLSLLTACGRRNVAPRVPVAKVGAYEEGIASWYGEPYHGRLAANGEVFDMEKLTAAHPSFPFETWVSVRNLTNKKTTEVRIIDRGPFVKGRLIDLSRAAAREIDLIRPGIAKVRITVIEPPKSYVKGKQFTVQVSSSRNKQQAEALRQLLAKNYREVSVRHRKANPEGGHPESWRVLVGRESAVPEAQKLMLRLREKFPNAFVVPFDAE